MESHSEFRDTSDPELAIEDREFMQAVDEAIHVLKLPPEQEEPLMRHARSFRGDDGLILRNQVREWLRILDLGLMLMAAGAEHRLEELHIGTLSGHLNLLEADDSATEHEEVQGLLDSIDPALSLLAEGAAHSVRKSRAEAEGITTQEGPTWPTGGL